MKYEIILTSAFKKELKNIKKRNKDLTKLTEIVNKLANDIERNLVAMPLTLDDGSRLKKLFSKICRKTLTN